MQLFKNSYLAFYSSKIFLFRYGLVLFLFAGSFGLSGCHDEHTGEEKKTNPEINEIIYNKMKELYLWYDELPAREELDFSAGAEDFFYNLLSDKDGKADSYYSRIIPEETYFTGGAHMLFGMFYNKPSLTVNFIIRDSPAEKAGFQRGDVITAVNGTTVNPDNIADILAPCTGETWFTIKRREETSGVFKELRLSIAGRELLYDNPVYLDTVYSETKAGKVGYLYFHEEFAEGPDDDTTIYLSLLRQAFARFSSQGVNQLILDLRDNSGGSLDMCQTLCTMLAPQEAIGQLFLTKKFNELDEDEQLFFDPGLIREGARLDLDKLVVIVSINSASASELVIHCLKPYLRDQLIVVGTKTYGKNVGMQNVDDLDIPWILLPVSFYCVNAEGSCDYSEGLQPDVFIEEDFSGWIYPLGDRREQLLQKALQTIGAE